MTTENKESFYNRDSITTNSKNKVTEGQKALEIAKVREQKLIDSGEYEWVTIQPTIGNSYQSLKKIKNGNI